MGKGRPHKAGLPVGTHFASWIRTQGTVCCFRNRTSLCRVRENPRRTLGKLRPAAFSEVRFAETSAAWAGFPQVLGASTERIKYPRLAGGQARIRTCGTFCEFG